MQRNTQKEWVDFPEFPETDREVYALVECDTYHDDDVPFITKLILKENDTMGAKYIWVDEEGEVLPQSVSVMKWRYVTESEIMSKLELTEEERKQADKQVEAILEWLDSDKGKEALARSYERSKKARKAREKARQVDLVDFFLKPTTI